MFRISVVALLFCAFTLSAAEITDVIDAFDGTDSFDANIEVNYRYEYQSTKIKRESYCTSGDDNCNSEKMGNEGVVKLNQFDYTRKDHIIEPVLKFGLYKDLQISFALPIYLSSTRKLDFNDKAKTAAGYDNTGVEIDNPSHGQAGNTFWNIEHTGGQDVFLPFKFYKGTELDQTGDGTNKGEAFSGLNYERSGLKTLDIAIKYNIVENDRDDTDPSWMIGFTYKAPISAFPEYTSNKEAMRRVQQAYGPYAEADMENLLTRRLDLNETSMGEGIHHLLFETALSKRYNFVEPFMRFYYEYKVSSSGNDVFKDYDTREFSQPGNHFGFNFGLDFVPFEKSYFDRDNAKRTNRRFSISLDLNFDHKTKGLEYSELSDFLALPTVVDEYSSLSGSLNLYYMPIPYVKVSLGAMFGYTTDHFLTDMPRGKDSNGDGVYDTSEIDPLYQTDPTLFNSINTVGNRILATETLLFAFNFKLHILF